MKEQELRSFFSTGWVRYALISELAVSKLNDPLNMDTRWPEDKVDGHEVYGPSTFCRLDGFISLGRTFHFRFLRVDIQNVI